MVSTGFTNVNHHNHQAGKNMCATIATIHVIANQMASSIPSTTPLGGFLW